MKKFENIMLDIETMGTNPDACILSIGAVEFDLSTGDIGNEFYVRVDWQSCVDLGMKLEPGTVKWWLQQDDIAKREILSGYTSSIEHALQSLSRFGFGKRKVWANSPSFDCAILKTAYKKLGEPLPWNYKNERCVRTLIGLVEDFDFKSDKERVKHHPIDDCRTQVEMCVKAWNELILK